MELSFVDRYCITFVFELIMPKVWEYFIHLSANGLERKLIAC